MIRMVTGVQQKSIQPEIILEDKDIGELVDKIAWKVKHIKILRKIMELGVIFWTYQ